MAQTPDPVLLSFVQAGEAHEFTLDLSAAEMAGGDLWLGTDEGTRLARLRPDGEGGYGDAEWFPLGELLDLPGKDDDEVDVEGLGRDRDDGALWVAGSHSPNRKKAEKGDTEEESRRRLSRVTRKGNRYTLARLPLVPGPGSSSLVPARGARLAGGRRRNLLTDALRDDEHLGRFLRIPGKDNGFNVEGLAAAGGRVFLGLRGPVLRGWAVIVVAAPEPDPDDEDLLRLGRVGKGKEKYRKLFLDLQGLGIRDIDYDGNDLLILAGPTMALRSDAVVLRWRDAIRAAGDEMVSRERLEPVLDLPYGSGSTESVDHPEGIAIEGEGADRALLVVYDSPSEARRGRGASLVLADRFRL